MLLGWGMHDNKREALIPLTLLAAASGARTTAGIAATFPRQATRAWALGELVLDKLPDIPDRIDPRLIAGRVAAGVLVGATVGHRTRHSRVGAAVLGGLIAFASAHLTYRMRRVLGERLPAFSAALVEDVLVVAAAAAGAATLRTGLRRAALAKARGSPRR